MCNYSRYHGGLTSFLSICVIILILKKTNNKINHKRLIIFYYLYVKENIFYKGGIFMKNLLVFKIVFCLVFLETFIFAQELPIFAGKNAPFNFRHRGEVTGITVDILAQIFKDNNLPFAQEKIVLDTWSSVFSQAIVTPNSVLITVTRLPEREEMLQWVGPITDVKLAIIAKKRLNIKMTDIKDLKGNRIVSVKNTAAERAFVKAGGDLNALERVSTPKQAYKMLEYDRVQAIIATDLPFLYEMVKEGLDANEYEVVYVIKKASYYISLHKDIDPKITKMLQKGLDDLKIPDSLGMSPYQKIMYKYFKDASLSEAK